MHAKECNEIKYILNFFYKKPTSMQPNSNFSEQKVLPIFVKKYGNIREQKMSAGKVK